MAARKVTDAKGNEWLRCQLVQPKGPGASVPAIPGFVEDGMTVDISVDHIVIVADMITPDPHGGMDSEKRERVNTNLYLQTGQWVSVSGSAAEFRETLGIKTS